MIRKIRQFLAIGLLAIALVPFSANAYTFLQNLRQGDRKMDVKELQIILNSNPATQVAQSGAGSPGQETSYFGPATKRAVKAFQELYRSEILDPAGLTQGSGYVGGMTRSKLSSLSSTSKIAPTANVTVSSSQSLLSNVPVLTHLSTTTLGSGDKLVVYGKNFLPTNTVVVSIELPDKYKDIVTASSTSLEIKFVSTVTDGLTKNFSNLSADVRSAVVAKLKSEMIKQDPSTDGEWYYPATVSVKNSNGTSNSLPIKINILKGV